MKKRVDEAIATVEAEAREALDAAKRAGETEVEHARAELATQTRALEERLRAATAKNEDLSSKISKAVKKGKGIEADKKKLEAELSDLKRQNSERQAEADAGAVEAVKANAEARLAAAESRAAAAEEKAAARRRGGGCGGGEGRARDGRARAEKPPPRLRRLRTRGGCRGWRRGGEGGAGRLGD